MRSDASGNRPRVVSKLDLVRFSIVLYRDQSRSVASWTPIARFTPHLSRAFFCARLGLVVGRIPAESQIVVLSPGEVDEVANI